jgi:hypothetical protein
MMGRHLSLPLRLPMSTAVAPTSPAASSPRGFRFWLVIIALCVSLLLGGIDLVREPLPPRPATSTSQGLNNIHRLLSQLFFLLLHMICKGNSRQHGLHRHIRWRQQPSYLCRVACRTSSAVAMFFSASNLSSPLVQSSAQEPHL